MCKALKTIVLTLPRVGATVDSWGASCEALRFQQER
jgi:hypothetical protein